MPVPFVLKTQRLLISRFQPSSNRHCDFLVSLWTTPEFTASIGGKPSFVTTRKAALAVITSRFDPEHERNGYGTYLVSLRPDSDTTAGENSVCTPTVEELLEAATPIGTVSLSMGVPPNCYGAPDLGFAVLPQFMRQGFASEASEAIMNHVRDVFGIDSFLGFHDPQNQASSAVFRKLRFEYREVHELSVFGGVRGAVWTRGVDKLEDVGL